MPHSGIMIQRWILLFAITGLGYQIGCGQVTDNPGTTDAGESPTDGAVGEAGFSFAVLTPSVFLPLDGMNAVEVEITRTGGFTGEVTVGPMSPPNGLFAPDVTISGDQTIARLVVGAQAPLVIGDTLSFDLVATAQGLPPRESTITDAKVSGRPGSFDDSFGANGTGLSAVSFGADDSGSFFDIEQAGADKIVVLGWGVGGLGAVRFAITRFLPSGAIDPAFAGGSLVRTDFESGSSGENARGVAVGHQVDGRIIGIGWHSAGSNFPPDVALARYSVGGAEGDPIFGNYRNGKSRIDLGGSEEIFDGLVLPDNKILAVGSSDSRLVIMRATATGALDPSFAAPSGFVAETLGTSAVASALILDNQDRILVTGHTELMGDRQIVILRYSADGQPDATFGDNGLVIAGAPDSSERAVAIAVRPDGRIVIAGETDRGGNGLDFEVRQFLDDGSPDQSFGAMGVTTTAITARNDVPEAMAIQPDGRVLVIGNTVQSSANEPVLARYTRDGELDPFFGTSGILSFSVGDFGVVRALLPVADNRLLIAGGDEGGSPGPGTYGILARLWL